MAYWTLLWVVIILLAVVIVALASSLVFIAVEMAVHRRQFRNQREAMRIRLRCTTIGED